jgi:hypothetical protein
LDAKQSSGTYATLVNGTVPSSQLPSFVDDVVEYASYSVLPSTGESGKLYVAVDTKKLWRWSGSGYVEISPSPGSTDSVTEGSNLYFTDARAQAALTSALSGKASTSHTHTASQITDFATESAKYGPVTSVNGQSGAVTISTGSNYTLPNATTSTLGGVIVGSGLSVSSGTVSAAVTSVSGRTGAVTLTSSDVGLSAVNNTSDASKPVSTLQAAADAAVQAYAIQRAYHTGSQAASTITGLAAVATSGSASDLATGTVPAAALPAATTSTLGGIIVGSGLSIASGVLSATGGGGGSGLTWSSVPASPTASGTAGQIAYDGSYFYVASATNTWVRTALSTWTVPVITISSQPSAQTASSGAATFSVTASVSPSATLSYQWQRQALGAGSYANVSGATSASLALTGMTNAANNADNYRVVVSSTGATSVTSSAAALTVPSAALLAIARDNGSSTFTGSGTTGSPFIRAAGHYTTDADGLVHYTWTASAACTVAVAFVFADDDDNSWKASVTKNGTAINIGTGGSPSTQSAGSPTLYSPGNTSGTLSASSGDVIRIISNAPTNSGVQPSQYFTNVSVSAA